MLLKGDVPARAPRKKACEVSIDPPPIGPCAPGVKESEIVEPGKYERGLNPTPGLKCQS